MISMDPVNFKVENKMVSEKKTSNTSFSDMLKSGADKMTGIIINGMAVAGPVIPGAAGLSAALSAAGAIKNSTAPNSLGVSQSSSSQQTLPANEVPAQDGSLIDSMIKLQESGHLMSMQYLELQEQMQQENRQFSTLSNILKTRHESAKTAIGNIR